MGLYVCLCNIERFAKDHPVALGRFSYSEHLMSAFPFPLYWKQSWNALHVDQGSSRPFMHQTGQLCRDSFWNSKSQRLPDSPLFEKQKTKQTRKQTENRKTKLFLKGLQMRCMLRRFGECCDRQHGTRSLDLCCALRVSGACPWGLTGGLWILVLLVFLARFEP